MAVAPQPDREREPGCAIVKRTTRDAKIALPLANLAGAVLTFVLGAWIVPPPEGIDIGDNLATNAVAFGVVMVIGLVLGTWLSLQVSRDVQSWLREERPPTPKERDATLRFPLRQTMVEALLWGLAVVLFFFVNLGTSDVLAFEAAIEVLIGGLLTCSLTYLLVERLNRDATARALETGVPEHLAGPAIGCRLLLTWAASSALPLLAIGLMGVAALGENPPSIERVGLAVVVLAAVGALVGAATMSISARSIAEPLRSLRAALARVEEGELDARVTIDDAGEIGVLQGGFNRMAVGLEERERLRDLFGRHVGEDVARQAIESEDVELGGETREAAVLFVDVIGSTTLASTHDPAEVVERLNAFFAVVVDTVSLHGGWVNKFEGVRRAHHPPRPGRLGPRQRPGAAIQAAGRRRSGGGDRCLGGHGGGGQRGRRRALRVHGDRGSGERGRAADRARQDLRGQAARLGRRPRPCRVGRAQPLADRPRGVTARTGAGHADRRTKLIQLGAAPAPG
jgi:adenylate cyclase